MPIRRRTLLLPAVFAAATAVLSSCTAEVAPKTAENPNQPGRVNTSPEQNRVRAQKVEEIANLVPPEIRNRGTLVVSVSGQGSPPLSFRADDDRTVIGVEIDVAQLVADVLGLRLELQPTSWENIFLSVRSGQHDVGFSNITVTEERKEIYDFATYRTDTVAFLARADSPLVVKGPPDIAGRTVSVSSGTNQEKILLDWDARNRAAGLAPVKFQYYGENSADYYLALRSGRIDLYVGPNPTLSYHATVSGESRVVGTVPGGGEFPAQIAATTRKGNGLVTALARAIDHEIAGGRYAEVLGRWNLGNEALPASQINPPGLPKSVG
ncbi:ABC transporter substrate-binding protein [Saccharopolyspora taberi]|uniref:ABC transporter substrate-binding protein n=1 Tax=Saccharopolyspora taberi TaxID=60895 RepID=A0ABN3VEK1_9PSEU